MYRCSFSLNSVKQFLLLGEYEIDGDGNREAEKKHPEDNEWRNFGEIGDILKEKGQGRGEEDGVQKPDVHRVISEKAEDFFDDGFLLPKEHDKGKNEDRRIDDIKIDIEKHLPFPPAGQRGEHRKEIKELVRCLQNLFELAEQIIFGEKIPE